MTRLGGSRGPTSTTKTIRDACGATWISGDLSPQPRMTDREYRIQSAFTIQECSMAEKQCICDYCYHIHFYS